MNEQNSVTLCGVLMYPLAVGKRAVVFSYGQFIRTAPIVAIHSRDAHEVRFATLDRMLYFAPGPADAICLRPGCLGRMT